MSDATRGGEDEARVADLIVGLAEDARLLAQNDVRTMLWEERILAALTAARAEEREACAKILDGCVEDIDDVISLIKARGQAVSETRRESLIAVCKNVAAEIRGRGGA